MVDDRGQVSTASTKPPTVAAITALYADTAAEQTARLANVRVPAKDWAAKTEHRSWIGSARKQRDNAELEKVIRMARHEAGQSVAVLSSRSPSKWGANDARSERSWISKVEGSRRSSEDSVLRSKRHETAELEKAVHARRHKAGSSVAVLKSRFEDQKQHKTGASIAQLKSRFEACERKPLLALPVDLPRCVQGLEGLEHLGETDSFSLDAKPFNSDDGIPSTPSGESTKEESSSSSATVGVGNAREQLGGKSGWALELDHDAFPDAAIENGAREYAETDSCVLSLALLDSESGASSNTVYYTAEARGAHLMYGRTDRSSTVPRGDRGCSGDDAPSCPLKNGDPLESTSEESEWSISKLLGCYVGACQQRSSFFTDIRMIFDLADADDD